MKRHDGFLVHEQLRSNHIELLERLQVLTNENNELKSKLKHIARSGPALRCDQQESSTPSLIDESAPVSQIEPVFDISNLLREAKEKEAEARLWKSRYQSGDNELKESQGQLQSLTMANARLVQESKKRDESHQAQVVKLTAEIESLNRYISELKLKKPSVLISDSVQTQPSLNSNVEKKIEKLQAVIEEMSHLLAVNTDIIRQKDEEIACLKEKLSKLSLENYSKTAHIDECEKSLARLSDKLSEVSSLYSTEKLKLSDVENDVRIMSINLSDLKATNLDLESKLARSVARNHQDPPAITSEPSVLPSLIKVKTLCTVADNSTQTDADVLPILSGLDSVRFDEFVKLKTENRQLKLEVANIVGRTASGNETPRLATFSSGSKLPTRSNGSLSSHHKKASGSR